MKYNTLDITLIIPYFNESKKLENTLNNIFDLTIKPKEIIFVNSSSKDNSNSILNELIKKYQYNNINIYNYSPSSTFPSTSINFGISKSNYDLIAIMDCDLIIPKNWLEVQFNLLNKNNYDVVFGTVVLKGCSDIDAAFVSHTYGYNKVNLCIPGTLCRKEIFYKIGFFENRRACYDISWRNLVKKNFNWSYDKSISLSYPNVNYANSFLFGLKKNIIYLSHSFGLKYFFQPYYYLVLLFLVMLILISDFKNIFYISFIYIIIRICSFIIKSDIKKLFNERPKAFLYSIPSMFFLDLGKLIGIFFSFINFLLRLLKFKNDKVINQSENIISIISGLEDGGAEKNLYNLVKYDNKNNHYVISLTTEGKYGQLMRKNNINFKCLNIKKRNILSLINNFLKLRKIIKEINPRIVHTWMYHADLYGGLATKSISKSFLIWNIRGDVISNKNSTFTIFILNKILPLLSYALPDLVTSCSKFAIKNHIITGYKKNFLYLPNGIDFNLNEKKYDFKNSVFKNFNDKSLFKISCISRFAKQKDFNTLFKTIAFFKKKEVNFQLFLAGNNIDKKNFELVNLINQYSLDKNITLLGQLENVNELLQFVDVNITTSSFGEGLPNVILESLSNGTPCISTNVGDAIEILKDIGWIANIKDYKKLSSNLEEALFEKNYENYKWSKRKEICKKYIKNEFTLDIMIEKYQDLYDNYKIKI